MTPSAWNSTISYDKNGYPGASPFGLDPEYELKGTHL